MTKTAMYAVADNHHQNDCDVIKKECLQGVAPDTADVRALVAHVDGAACKQLDEDNLVAAEKKRIRTGISM